MGVSAKLYIYGVVAAGASAFAISLANWSSPQFLAWLVYVVLSALASLVKLKLPGMRGSYSLSFLLLLFGIVHFSLAETLIAGCVGALAQTVSNRKERPSMVRVLFNMANLALSVSLCSLLARVLLSPGLDGYRAATMALIACVYFVVNTVLVSGVLTLVEGMPFREASEQWYLWSFPYYLVGAALVGLIPSPGQSVRTDAWLILLPLLYLLHFFLGVRELRPSSGTPKGDGGGDALPQPAGFYIRTILAAGLIPLVAAAHHWQSRDPLRFVCYLALAVVASTLKVRLPHLKGTVSLSFILLLVAIADFSFSEAVVMSAVVGVVQCVWRPKRRPKVPQVLFNLASLALSTSFAYLVCRWSEPMLSGSLTGLLILATLTLYFSNTILVSAVLSLIERGSLAGIWQHCYFWCCPYYLVGATAAGLMIATGRVAGWRPSVLVLPLMALVYIAYRAHVAQAQSRQPLPGTV